MGGKNHSRADQGKEIVVPGGPVVETGPDVRRTTEVGRGLVDKIVMDYQEARQLLETQVEEWRHRSYAELSQEVGRWRRFETTGPSGQHYEGHIQVFWQGGVHGPVKVIGSIDDGGWRTFVPVVTDFTVTPDGTLLSH